MPKPVLLKAHNLHLSNHIGSERAGILGKLARRLDLAKIATSKRALKSQFLQYFSGPGVARFEGCILGKRFDWTLGRTGIWCGF